MSCIRWSIALDTAALATEVLGAVLLEPLGALDAHERHQEQRHDRRAQPVERGADAAVHVACDVEDAAGDQHRNGEEHADVGHAVGGTEQRCRIVE